MESPPSPPVETGTISAPPNPASDMDLISVSISDFVIWEPGTHHLVFGRFSPDGSLNSCKKEFSVVELEESTANTEVVEPTIRAAKQIATPFLTIFFIYFPSHS